AAPGRTSRRRARARRGAPRPTARPRRAACPTRWGRAGFLYRAGLAPSLPPELQDAVDEQQLRGGVGVHDAGIEKLADDAVLPHQRTQHQQRVRDEEEIAAVADAEAGVAL